MNHWFDLPFIRDTESGIAAIEREQMTKLRALDVEEPDLCQFSDLQQPATTTLNNSAITADARKKILSHVISTVCCYSGYDGAMQSCIDVLSDVLDEYLLSVSKLLHYSAGNKNMHNKEIVSRALCEAGIGNPTITRSRSDIRLHEFYEESEDTAHLYENTQSDNP